MSAEKGQVWSDVLEALRMGCDNAPDIADMLGISRDNAANYLKRMNNEGVIKRVDRGRYAVVEAKNGHRKSGVQPYMPPARNGNGHGLAESDRRRIDMPAFLKQRSAITLFVEHSPQELEGVMRFELQLGGSMAARAVRWRHARVRWGRCAALERQPGDVQRRDGIPRHDARRAADGLCP